MFFLLSLVWKIKYIFSLRGLSSHIGEFSYKYYTFKILHAHSLYTFVDHGQHSCLFPQAIILSFSNSIETQIYVFFCMQTNDPITSELRKHCQTQLGFWWYSKQNTIQTSSRLERELETYAFAVHSLACREV